MAKQAKIPAKKKPAAKKLAPKPRPKKVEWVAALRAGEAGVKRWNKLTLAGRQAVKLAGADLSGCDLAGGNFNGIRAKAIKLGGAKLAGTRFDSAQMLDADFSGADLTEACFARIVAPGATFRAAKLTGADFDNAHVRRCVFTDANLTGASLKGSQLHGCDFTGGTLTDAVWDGATFDEATKWPAGFAVPGELLWEGKGTDPRLSGKGAKAVATDINGLMARLHSIIDPKRMTRTLDMLKKGKNQLFSEVEPEMVRGIVKSQTEPDKVYSCLLTADGTYACCSADMAQCLGLRGEPCKHLLVLVIGLARAGKIDPRTADEWVVAATKKNTRWNKTVQNHMADSLLKYKGAQAGEVDWRPTETLPEDFYTL